MKSLQLDQAGYELVWIHIIWHQHVNGRCCSFLFFMAKEMKVFMICAAIGQAMNKPWIILVSKDNGFIRC